MDYQRVLIFASLRLLPIGLSFLITLMVSRLFSAQEAGDYFYSFTIIVTFAAMCSLGLQQSMVRFFGTHGITKVSNRYLVTALLWSIIATLLIFLLLIIALPYFAQDILKKDQLSEIFFAHTFSLFGLVISSLIAYAFQGVRRPLLTLLFLGFVANLLFLVISFILVYFEYSSFTIVGLAWLYSLCNLFSCVLALVFWYSQNGATASSIRFYDAGLLQSALPLWLSQVMGLLLKHSGLIIAGVYVSSADVALLSVSLRTSELLTLLLVAVTLLASPEYSRLWAENNRSELSRLVRSNFLFLGGFGLVVVMALIILSAQVLSLFGEGYSNASHLLIVLAAGHWFAMVFATSISVLNMTGHEREVSRGMIISVGISFPVAVFLTSQYGVEGAAFSCAFANIVSGLLCVNSFKKHLGHWPWQIVN